ncbi:hypothetical protein CI109_102712 [Kwoniella shandongensis]|uniref:NmrA-like domain-containing protein n=1 Tax=Kwoniella shandongensis TaxID=1734106 RepID=A0A5M6BVI2_9TREE|nr:uncharacterized protein CI109_004966 [Kwoniella shandongensis]KAA5526763.1 hypothetical protein CI109_004966 [Kwoniella shandongensis]
MSKILVVVGATGKQGGSVITSILNDPKAKAQFSIRAITRDTSKPAAKALEEKGVETVSADLGDKDSLVKALQGAYAVFSVTDFWATMSREIEYQQGKNVADAAKTAGVQHFVWSTLINTSKSTNGKLTHISHFDGKADIEEYIKSMDLPASYYLPGFYASNLPGSLLRKDDSTGKYVLNLPVKEDAQIPIVDIEKDTGKFVKAILLNREATLGKYTYGTYAYLTPQQVVDGFKEAFPKAGEGATFQPISDETYKGVLGNFGMPEPVQVEMLENMLLLNKEFGYYAGADLKESLSIVTDKLVTWPEYLKTVPAFKDLE